MLGGMLAINQKHKGLKKTKKDPLVVRIPSLKLAAKAPENGWLEDEFPFGMAQFQGRNVSFRKSKWRWDLLNHHGNHVRPLVVGKLLSSLGPGLFSEGTLVRCSVSFRNVLGRIVLHLPQSVGGTGLESSSVHQGSNKIRQEWWTSTTHVKENKPFIQKTVSFDAYQRHNTIISGILLSTIYTYSYSNTCIYTYIHVLIGYMYACLLV